METISDMIELIPDTVSIAITPKVVAFHQSPAATTQFDVALTHEITSSILLAIAIIGIIVVSCMAITARSKHKAQELRFKFEEKKRNEDQTMQEHKDRVDLAWRCLHDFYNKGESEVTDSEQKMAEASREFLASAFKEAQLHESDITK